MMTMDGYDVCRVLKENDATKDKDIPVIFITAETDEDAIEKAYSSYVNHFVGHRFKIYLKLPILELIATFKQCGTDE